MERHGICRNVGVCSRANKEQIITDDDAEFVCPECGEPLQPVKPDVNNGKGGGKRKATFADCFRTDFSGKVIQTAKYICVNLLQGFCCSNIFICN